MAGDCCWSGVRENTAGWLKAVGAEQGNSMCWLRILVFLFYSPNTNFKQSRTFKSTNGHLDSE